MPRASKQTKRQRLLAAINPSTPKKRFILFILIFAIIGGGYMAYRSFAFTVMTGNDGEFTSLTPARILDTRNGTGGYSTPVGPGQTVPVQITGRGGVPINNVKAVVMNVTVTDGTSDSFVSLWPNGESRPNASNINFSAGQTIPNQVTVKLGADGKVQIFNGSGKVNVIFDVAGYYSNANGTPGSRFTSLTPARILDTRNGTGGYSTPVGPGQTVPVQITGRGGVPTAGVKAVSMNVTVTGGTAPSFLTVWPNGARPNSSSLNFGPGQTIPNQVTVQVGADGKIQLFNANGDAHVIFDVSGYFTEETTEFKATQAGRFVPITPKRIYDSRTSGNVPLKQAPLKLWAGSVPSYYNEPKRSAMVLNVAVTNPTTASFLTLWPANKSRPSTSNLNFGPGQTIANQVTVALDENQDFLIYNAAGSTNVIVDVAGFYYADEYSARADGQTDSNTIFSSNTNTQFDFTVTSVPPKDPAANIGLGLWGGGHVGFSFNKGVSTLRTSCSSSINECKMMAPGGTITNGSISIPYSIQIGTTYTVYSELKMNQPGYPGRWTFMSIKPAGGTVTNLWATALGVSEFSLSAGAGSYGFVSHFSCKTPKLLSWTVENVLYDNKSVEFPKDSLNDFFRGGSETCKGVAKVDYFAGASNKKVMSFKVGVPQAERDTKAPVIGNATPVGNNVFRVTSEDNVVVTDIKVYFQNVVSPFWAQASADSGYEKVRTLDFIVPAGLTGSQPVRIVATDNSGNTTETTQTITLP